MSKSRTDGRSINRFDDWIAHEFRSTGGFTALVILVAIGELSVTPLRSTYFHLIGDEIRWAELSTLFAQAGGGWDGVVFAVRPDKDTGGPIADAAARVELRALADALTENRLVLNENHFFDRWGRRLKIEEVMVQ